jgi:hypothetical protein
LQDQADAAPVGQQFRLREGVTVDDQPGAVAEMIFPQVSARGPPRRRGPGQVKDDAYRNG